jgi:CheY-like chemotaxis protein
MPPSDPLSGMSILYVDDSPDERELFEVRFGLLGASVRAVDTVETALDLLASSDVDLLVSDIRLGERDGYDLIRAVRALSPDDGGFIPAVAVTGMVRGADREAVLDAGYDRYISKPYDADAIVRAASDLRDLIDHLRDYRSALRAMRARNRPVTNRPAERHPSFRQQQDRMLVRVRRERAQLAHSVAVMRAADAFLRERGDVGPIDQLRVGSPVDLGNDIRVWCVTAYSNNRRTLVEVSSDLAVRLVAHDLGQP